MFNHLWRLLLPLQGSTHSILAQDLVQADPILPKLGGFLLFSDVAISPNRLLLLREGDSSFPWQGKHPAPVLLVQMLGWALNF